MLHVHVSQDSISNDHFHEGLRCKNENKSFEQQENHINNQLFENPEEPIPSDNSENQTAKNNRADMKIPPKIVIGLTTLTCSQSITQNPLDNVIMPTTNKFTCNDVTQAVHILQQSYGHD